MIHWLKEIGRGKRGARDLTYDEALQAADAILTGKATPAQIGAFFLAERIKMESVEELAAFADICRSHAARTVHPGSLDCAGPYDGRAKSFMATFATAFVLAAAGQRVTLHGMPSLPPKWGVTPVDLLRELGVDAATLPVEQAIRTATDTGVLFASAEQWCPPLLSLRSIREELGMRTVLNTAEKLVDYGQSPYIVFGVFHNTVFERMSSLISRLGYERGLIVQGAEGSEDLFIHRPTRTYRVENGEAHLQVINPEAYGLEQEPPELAWDAPLQLATTREVLQGTAHMAFVHQVLLNAAVRLELTGRASSVEEGIYTCKALLDSGEPWRLFQRWQQSLQPKTAADSVAQQALQP